VQEDESAIPDLKRFYASTIYKVMASDEQVLLQSPYLTINLADPFTFEQLEIPVRGKMCQHVDCFDLVRFMETNLQPKEVT
jgi:hypothetical protein